MIIFSIANVDTGTDHLLLRNNQVGSLKHPLPALASSLANSFGLVCFFLGCLTIASESIASE
jgi:hypothetical protein